MNIDEYRSLTRKCEQAKEMIARQFGIQESVLRQIKQEFKCSGQKDAKKKLADLSKEVETLDKKIQKAKAKFEERYRELLAD